LKGERANPVLTAAGHGDVPRAASATGYDEGSAEFVYYCWPGTRETDMVPYYATSIEGATALCFSPDAKRILLVWERGMWSTPGGAVNAGESKLDALARELFEEVGVEVDISKPKEYLAGWSESRARDNLVNDSFAAFAVHLKNETIRTDKKEIFEAEWFDVEQLLSEWNRLGQPKDKKLKIEMRKDRQARDKDDRERNTIACNVLKWLTTHKDGKGHVVTRKEETDQMSVKVAWGMSR
jgi:8-oxo-dGTP pyrophosphatase MutT (NUDIX family)